MVKTFANNCRVTGQTLPYQTNYHFRTQVIHNHELIKSFQKLQGTQVVNTLKSGAEFSGTARNIKLSNLYEAEVERSIAKYNLSLIHI